MGSRRDGNRRVGVSVTPTGFGPAGGKAGPLWVLERRAGSAGDRHPQGAGSASSVCGGSRGDSEGTPLRARGCCGFLSPPEGTSGDLLLLSENSDPSSHRPHAPRDRERETGMKAKPGRPRGRTPHGAKDSTSVLVPSTSPSPGRWCPVPDADGCAVPGPGCPLSHPLPRLPGPGPLPALSPPVPSPGPRAAESLLRAGSEGGPPGLTAMKRLARNFSLWSQLQTRLSQLLWGTRLIREDKVLEHADTPPPVKRADLQTCDCVCLTRTAGLAGRGEARGKRQRTGIRTRICRAAFSPHSSRETEAWGVGAWIRVWLAARPRPRPIVASHGGGPGPGWCRPEPGAGLGRRGK